MASIGQFDVINSFCDQTLGTCYKQNNKTYTEVRELLFGFLHLEKNNQGYFIQCIYCQKPYTNENFPPGQGPKPFFIPDYKILNTEHSWPQSKFSNEFSKTLQKTDLHAVFPVDSQVNNLRNNLEFAEVNQVYKQICPASKTGNSIEHPNQKFFEPPDEVKGDLSRAVFYFSIRYRLPISGHQEHFLKNWHKEDPPDEFEIKRNNLIFEIQNNRNPFIDHPYLVELIDDF